VRRFFIGSSHLQQDLKLPFEMRNAFPLSAAPVLIHKE
jgi:hypothetical protein